MRGALVLGVRAAISASYPERRMRPVGWVAIHGRLGDDLELARVGPEDHAVRRPGRRRARRLDHDIYPSQPSDAARVAGVAQADLPAPATDADRGADDDRDALH